MPRVYLETIFYHLGLVSRGGTRGLVVFVFSYSRHRGVRRTLSRGGTGWLEFLRLSKLGTGGLARSCRAVNHGGG